MHKIKSNRNMFTLNQIKEIHSNVKSGADFPQYVQNLIELGLVRYHLYVSDGHSHYFGNDNFNIQSEPKYSTLVIAEESNKLKFQYFLKIHQAGQTDYMTFCQHSAETGVEKWTVDMIEMTCTYYDKQENKMLIEEIPTIK